MFFIRRQLFVRFTDEVTALVQFFPRPSFSGGLGNTPSKSFRRHRTMRLLRPKILLLTATVLLLPANSFLPGQGRIQPRIVQGPFGGSLGTQIPPTNRLTGWVSTPVSAIKVPAAELEGRLSDGERRNVRVARQAGPSVAFVTSIWPRSNNTRTTTNGGATAKSNLPPGQGLGSGSAFVVDPDGYLVTNYHVIERAYQLQAAEETFHSISSQIAGNISQATGFDLMDFLGDFVRKSFSIRPPPKVFVRLDSETQYLACRIVDVKPELDLAVLQVEPTSNETDSGFQPMVFGSSSELLVGQGLIAIGNPFGLDKTVTTGVVSALNREIRTSGNNGIVEQPIRNCIQTDCAINPGV